MTSNRIRQQTRLSEVVTAADVTRYSKHESISVLWEASKITDLIFQSNFELLDFQFDKIVHYLI